jgi:hypothetical protein
MSWQQDARPGYYGAPILKPAPWRDWIGWYFFTGGLAGASSVLAGCARAADAPVLARHARRWALAGLLPSPVLLTLDLGRPARFVNMLRVAKPTSPMSVGSWLLSAYGPSVAVAALVGERSDAAPIGALADVVAGSLGAAVVTYTAVLISDTAVPVWREARRHLPYLFAAGAAASAGAATTLSGPPAVTGPARALGAVGALAEVGVARRMEASLGPISDARRRGAAGAFRRAAETLTMCGAAGLLLGGRRRKLAAIGSLMTLGGAVCQRLCVLRSGAESARDPVAVLATQPASG